MEKRKAHHSLTQLKDLIKDEATRVITRSSLKDANVVGLSETEVVDTILELKQTNFYKSMTTHQSSSKWQDVYKTSKNNINLYIKLHISDNNEGAVVSFKKDEGGEK